MLMFSEEMFSEDTEIGKNKVFSIKPWYENNIQTNVLPPA
jgi:hypothetical protein